MRLIPEAVFSHLSSGISLKRIQYELRLFAACGYDRVGMIGANIDRMQVPVSYQTCFPNRVFNHNATIRIKSNWFMFEYGTNIVLSRRFVR